MIILCDEEIYMMINVDEDYSEKIMKMRRSMLR
jgi:hypothetical protein